MSTTDPRADLLRAAGHTDAADLLDKLAGFTTAAADPATHEPAAQSIPVEDMNPEQLRAHEGQAMLNALMGQRGAA
jgi:hypothetical protein